MKKPVILQNIFSRFPSVLIIGELRFPDDEYIQESQLYRGESSKSRDPPLETITHTFISTNQKNTKSFPGLSTVLSPGEVVWKKKGNEKSLDTVHLRKNLWMNRSVIHTVYRALLRDEKIAILYMWLIFQILTAETKTVAENSTYLG
jgi:hypothetical protein